MEYEALGYADKLMAGVASFAAIGFAYSVYHVVGTIKRVKHRPPLEGKLEEKIKQ